MNHPGYRLTDVALFTHELSPAAKLVLGITLAIPERNPSVRQLEQWLPLSRRAIHNAQDELEATGCRYDRPYSAADRNTFNPRFARSNRLASVPPVWEPVRRGNNVQPSVYLPGLVAETLPRERKYALLTLLYVREQIRRGAVQMPDPVAAMRLGVTERWVKEARRLLRERGVLKSAKRRYSPPIFRVEGVHVPEKKFDPSMTPERFQLHGRAFIATGRQFAVVQRLASALPSSALSSAFPMEADDLIQALRDAAKRVHSAHDSTTTAHGSLPSTSERLLDQKRPTSRPPELEISTSTTRASRATKVSKGQDNGNDNSASRADSSDRGNGHRRRNEAARERWVFSSDPLFYVWADTANEKTRERIEAYRNNWLAKAEKADADIGMRRLLLRCNGDGRKLLTLLDVDPQAFGVIDRFRRHDWAVEDGTMTEDRQAVLDMLEAAFGA